MAAKKNFQVDQGATFYSQIQYLNEDRTPVDLEGCSAKMQVRDVKGGRKVICTLTSDDGIYIDTESATLSITIQPQFTKKFSYPKSSYDIIITDTNNNKIRVLEGYFSLNREVTI